VTVELVGVQQFVVQEVSLRRWSASRVSPTAFCSGVESAS
jgi:hypothetical protein